MLTDEEKEQRKKEKKDKDKTKDSQEIKKRKSQTKGSSNDQPLTAAQKKKILEEKNALEKSRISAMKSSSEPVWKQARASLASTVATSSSAAKSTSPRPTPSTAAAATRPVETPLERARRLCQLIELRIKTEEKKGPGEFDAAGIIKILNKARTMELSLTEWAESHFIELVNVLRKYQHSSEIAKEAKEIRSFLKNKMTAMAVTDSATTSSVASTEVAPPPPPPVDGN